MTEISVGDLVQLISEGESERVEFKTRLDDSSVARVLSAFANTSGGVLLFGTGDRGEILGLSADEVKGGSIAKFNGCASRGVKAGRTDDSRLCGDAE